MSRAFVASFSGPAPPGVRARRIALPPPGGEPALGELAGRFAAERPDEAWLASDPSDGGFHLLATGDPTRLDELARPEPGPSRLDAVGRLAGAALRLPLRAAGAARHPDRAVGGVLATGERALGAAASLLWSRPGTPYEEGGDGAARVAWLRFEAERLAPLTEGPGGGVDSVLASAVSRALRDDLDRLGHDGEAADANRLAGEVLGPAAEAPGRARLDGRAARAVRPLPLPPPGIALGLAALRDPGGVTVGVAADPAVLDPQVLAGELEVAMDELLEAAPAPVEELRAEPAAPEPPAPEPAAPVAPAPPPDEPPEPPEPHVESPTELVAEVAEPGAEEGAGPQVRVDEPWPGYDALAAEDVVDRLTAASGEEVAVVAMYERAHRGRRSVVEAAERALSRR